MNESTWICELIREIADRIAAKLEISPELVRSTGCPTVRRFSITQRFTVDAPSFTECTSLIAKTRRFSSQSAFAEAVEEPRTQQLAKQEYEAHRKAFTIFSGHKSMSVPELFDLHKDLATIVMEVIPGESLARSVSSLRALTNYGSKQDLQARFSQAGDWLRTFHQEITEQEPAIWKRESFDRLIADHLETLQNAGISQRRFNEITNGFERRIAEVDNRTPLVFGTIHGDFKPAHVLFDGKQLAVIDFGTTRIEYGVADAGNFLADLACNAFGPRVVRRARLKQLVSAFSNAYHGKNPAEASVAVNLYCAMNLLRLWRKRRLRFPNGTSLRKLDKVIDLSRSRRLLNHSYVDRWFEQTIIGVLSSDTRY